MMFSVHGSVKGGLKSNVFLTSVAETTCFTLETLVRSFGVHLKLLALKSLSFDFQAQKSFKIGKNVDWQQHTYWTSRQTVLPLFGFSASLCESRELKQGR